MQTIDAIKVYGERNTGTNYVSDLLAANFSVPQLRGTAHRSFAILKLIRVLRRAGFRGLAAMVSERAANRYFARNMDRTLGWKHSRVPVEHVLRQPERLGVLALVKNPYSFLLSLYRRPYHDYHVRGSFEEFVEKSYTIQDRDLMDTRHATPVAIWVAKVRSYLELGSKLESVILARYEDILRDEPGFLAQVSTAWSLDRPDVWVGKQDSTKDKTKNQSDYRDYYLNERWREKLTPRAIDAINRQLDESLVKQTGYEILGHDSVRSKEETV